MGPAEDCRTSADLMADAWSLAAASPVRSSTLRSASLASTRENVSATVGAGGEYGIMVVLSRSEQVAISENLRDPYAALHAEISHYTDGELRARALHVWCRDGQCVEAFAMFCALFLERLGQPRASVAKSLADCYNEFSRLLRTGASPSITRIVGVVGELIVLREALRLDASAVRSWRGPRGDRHDFGRGNVALEVKTTLRADLKSPTVHVGALDQLEVPRDGRLFLHVVRLEQTDLGPLSVRSLIDEIRLLANQVDISQLEEFMESLGVSAALDDPSFLLTDSMTFEVTGAFPRLTKERFSAGDVDPGVCNISYDLNLALARPFATSLTTALSVLVSGGAA